MARSLSTRLDTLLRDSGVGTIAMVSLRATAVTAVLAGSTVVVYATGGTKHVWPHLMYLAIVASGVWFGRSVGVLTAVAAGLLVGPAMPLDVSAGIPQPGRGWLVRMAFFVAVGAMAGYARHRFDRLLDRRRQFVSSVSHELRTPLSAVVGFAEVLAGEWDSLTEVEKRELVDHVRHESLEVAHVVDDLLVAARIDGGRLHIECQDVDVRAITDSIVSGLAERADRIRVDGSAHSWADPVRVKQIVRNLVTNALVHGGQRVVVDVRNGSDVVTVTVTDDGPGIPAAILPRVFEPFVDSDRPSTMPPSVGLGLAVSRELARRMDGRLTYQREGGQSAFVLELPAAPHQRPARTPLTVPTG